jgi:hypothetical protein
MPPVAGAAKGLSLRNPRIQRSSNAVHSELKALATRVISLPVLSRAVVAIRQSGPTSQTYSEFAYN